MSGCFGANGDTVLQQRIPCPSVKAAVGDDASNRTAQLHKSLQGRLELRGWAGFIKECIGNIF
jgi:hypothetical protein